MFKFQFYSLQITEFCYKEFSNWFWRINTLSMVNQPRGTWVDIWVKINLKATAKVNIYVISFSNVLSWMLWKNSSK